MSNLSVIGRNAKVDLVGYAKNVPAKVDTGADSSAVWASNIVVDKDGVLHFVLFGKGSDFYTGEVLSYRIYKVAQVRSSNGGSQIRFQVKMPVQIADKRVRVSLNLSDRSKNKYPVLIGRRTLAGRFLVDVRRSIDEPSTPEATQLLNQELQKNPHAFYKKYSANSVK